MVSALGSISSSMRLTKNGTAIAGSQVTSALGVVTLGLINLAAGSTMPFSGNIITTLSAGDILKVQVLGTNAAFAPAGSGTLSPSSVIVITRIA